MPTRIDLRSWIASRVDDFAKFTVDTPAVGALSQATLSDSLLNQVDTKYWEDADVIVEYAGGTYDQRRVTSYTPTISGLSGGTIRVDASLSLLPSTNTNFYLHRKFRVDTYNFALNAALRNASDQGLVECLKTNEGLVATTRIWEYTVPTGSGIERLLDVYWLDDLNYNQPISISNRNWLTRRVGGVLTLVTRQDSTIPSGKTIRLVGVGGPAALSSDGQSLEAEVPVEYVVDYAVAELRLGKWQGSDADDSARQATFLRQNAEARLRDARSYVNRGRVWKRW